MRNTRQRPFSISWSPDPLAGKKWMRAIEIARDNHMPYVSFVESAGADLRVRTGGGEKKQSTDRPFAESGRFFMK